jgi:hypothetical protein
MVFGLPRVFAQFGSSQQSFPASATVNPKGGTDSRVFAQCKSYVEQLYPDAKDEAGFRVLLKIDGGPGRLNLNSLAELRACRVYLFPGVQNTTNVSQVTDQNNGIFKSLLRQYVQVLMNEAYREAQGNGLAPSGLSRKCYGLLLSV